jgi:hypothetical protein
MLRRSGAAVTAFVGASLLTCGNASPPADPRSWVPADALAVGEIDVFSLGRAAFVKRLLASDAASGVRALEATCGYDVLSRVRKLGIVVPKTASDAPEIGLVAIGRLEEDRLLECAGRRARDRGSSLGTKREGDVELHFDRDASGGALAFPAAGVVLGGTRPALAQMIGAWRGTRERMGAGAEHFALHDRIGRDRSAWLAARIPEAVRRRWREDAPAEMRPLLEVSWVVLGLRVWEGVQISGIVRATDVRAATLLERVARSLLDRGRREPAFVLSPFGPVFERTIVDREGQEVTFSLTLSERQIDGMAGRIDDLEKALSERSGGAP